MKQKQMTAIAVTCGLACATCVALFMTNVQGEADAARAEALARYGGEQVEVYVATRDIVAGERLDLSSVETRTWVSDLLPENAVRSASDAVGKTATSAIFKGEVITVGRFEAERDLLEVPVGKEAVSVPAKAVQAVGGAIRSGMSVDIYASGDSATTLIAQDVKVLETSAGKSSFLTSGDSGWITLSVEPERVQEIIAAASRTTLYFTLPGAPLEYSETNSEGELAASPNTSQSSSASEAASDSANAQVAGSSGSSSSASSKVKASSEKTQGGDR